MGAPAWARRTALLVALAAVACGPRTPPGPVVSPTGIVYEPGIPPRETRESQTATLYLRQERFERALELALEGAAADTTNPVHYFLAGAAYARLGRLAEADRMFDEAERLYPAYELETEPEREAAWAGGFNAGLEAYGRGEVEVTIETWREAIALSDLRPEAHRNLASVLTLEGRYDEAIQTYRGGLAGLEKRPATRVLTAEQVAGREAAAREMEEELAGLLLLTERYAEAEPILRRLVRDAPDDIELRGELAAALAGSGRETEAREMYESLLDERDLQATQLFNFGVALFRAEDFERASEAFERLTALRPHSRDAWFNYANSLFAAESWDELAAAGDRLAELDPLSENAHLITARAHLERGDRDAARGRLAHADAAPVFLDQLQLRRAGVESRVEGRVTGNAAEPGTPVRLRFVFYATDGSELGAETVTLSAPPEGESARFEVALGERAATYRYELVR